MQALSIAAAGMMSAAERFDASARRTAAAPLNNLAEEMVERITAGHAFKANAVVIRTAGDKLAAQFFMIDKAKKRMILEYSAFWHCILKFARNQTFSIR